MVSEIEACGEGWLGERGGRSKPAGAIQVVGVRTQTTSPQNEATRLKTSSESTPFTHR